MNDKQTAYYTVKEDEVRVDSPYNPIRHDAAEYLAKRLDVPVEDALVAGQKYIKQRMKRKLRLEGDRFYLIDTPINP